MQVINMKIHIYKNEENILDREWNEYITVFYVPCWGEERLFKKS